MNIFTYEISIACIKRLKKKYNILYLNEKDDELYNEYNQHFISWFFCISGMGKPVTANGDNGVCPQITL